MVIWKNVSLGIALFVVIVVLAVGVSTRFDYSLVADEPDDPYLFVEDFLDQWAPALGAAGTLIVAVLAYVSVLETRRDRESERQHVVRALHDEMLSNIVDIQLLRKQMLEPGRSGEHRSLDTAVFRDMSRSGQLYWLRSLRMRVLAVYKVIGQYNEDAGHRSEHGALLNELAGTLEALVGALETRFSFLRRSGVC